MSKLGDDNTIKSLKKLRDGIDGVITVCEKDEDEVTEEEVEAVVGKFMMTLIEMDALK